MKQINFVNDNNKEIKYPFNGKAPNLIDKFLVLGYQQKTIDFAYQNCNIDQEENLKNDFNLFQFDERPIIINEICNDYSKDLLDNDLILKIIFPNYPKMYFFIKKILNQEEEKILKPYSVIFSISPKDDSGSIKPYNGLAYIFYALQEYKNDRKKEGYLYVPTSYIILSEYPYFYQFNEICKNIYNNIKKEDDEIPIDIIIYNTIKFIPSPINKSINLVFGNHFGIRHNYNFDIKRIISNYNSNSEKEKNEIPSMFFPQLSGYPIIDINISFIFLIIPVEIIIEAFIFSFLEYNIVFYSSNLENLNMILYLFKCFNYPFNDSIYYENILSISKALFMSETSTFIDNACPTMIGVSSKYDPEFLTTKKINDHFVFDIDKKKFFFFYQEENDKVEEILNLHDYIRYCIELIENYSNNDKKAVKDISKDEIHLYDCINNLMEELMNKSKKVTSLDYKNAFNNYKPSFFNLFWYESDKEYIESNKKIQEAFYLFIINIYINLGIKDVLEMKYFGEDNNLGLINNYIDIINDFEDVPNSRVPSFVKEYYIPTKNIHQLNRKNIVSSKVKKIFLESLKNSSKYKRAEIIDLYKIPYTFINEFIYYFQFKYFRNKIFIFKSIDQFYGKKNLLDFEELVNKKEDIEDIEEKKINNKKEIEKEKRKEKKERKDKIEIEKEKEKEINSIINFKEEDENFKNIYLFTFDNFSDYYQKYLRALINREQEDDKENFSKVKSINRLYKKYKRNNYFLSQKILNIYITFTNNNLDELLRTFKIIKCENKMSEKDKFKNLGEISIANFNNITLNKKILDSEIEKSLEESKLIIDERIDYFYLFKNRISYDKILKVKYFGTFDNIEISNVIEDNFILERYFSSYTLFKYSLLNVLAVTREIESKIVNNKDVIQIICDFCDITKLVNKKYMNIYLKIFKEIYKNKESREKLQIKECLNMISLYFKKKIWFYQKKMKNF